MAYTADSIPSNHGEFSGGPGLIDPELRKDRVLEPWQQRMEIMFTNPAPESVARAGGELAPGTSAHDAAMDLRVAEVQLEQDPALVPLPRIQLVLEDET